MERYPDLIFPVNLKTGEKDFDSVSMGRGRRRGTVNLFSFESLFGEYWGRTILSL